MCAMEIIVRPVDTHVQGTHSFLQGFRPARPTKKIVTEDDVLAYALFLEKRGLEDEAEELLERYLKGYRNF